MKDKMEHSVSEREIEFTQVSRRPGEIAQPLLLRRNGACDFYTLADTSPLACHTANQLDLT